jgi:hypothetical protein
VCTDLQPPATPKLLLRGASPELSDMTFAIRLKYTPAGGCICSLGQDGFARRSREKQRCSTRIESSKCTLAVWAASPNCVSRCRVFLQRAKVPPSTNAPQRGRQLTPLWACGIISSQSKRERRRTGGVGGNGPGEPLQPEAGREEGADRRSVAASPRSAPRRTSPGSREAEPAPVPDKPLRVRPLWRAPLLEGGRVQR